MTIDEALRARAGERISVTVFPASSGYQANISTDGKSWRVEMGTTAETALKKALGILPGASGPTLVAPEPTSGSVFE